MSASPDKSQGFIPVILVNLLLIAVLVELLSVCYFFYEKGFFYYTRTPDSPSRHTKEASNSVSPAATALVIHPILGFSQRPGIVVNEQVGAKRLKGLIDSEQLDEVASLTANNLGFFSPYDYPYSQKDNEFVVGIFGGSVAQWFALQGKEDFAYLLKEKFPYLTDKDIVILNMAQGGYKQPQQIILMNYMLALGQDFDLIINIDGFNEVALGVSNRGKNVHEGFPAAFGLLPLVELANKQSISNDQLLLLAQSLKLKKELQLLEIDITESVFASVAAFKTLYSNTINRQYQQTIHDLDYLQKNENEESIIYIQPADNHIDQYNLAIWERSVGQMHALSSELRIPFISIVQANQYYTDHVFSEVEAPIALAASSPYKSVIARYYPDLEILAAKMKERGIQIESAISIFDSETRAVYTDDCCHYTPLGDKILAAFIVDNIDQKLSDLTPSLAEE